MSKEEQKVVCQSGQWLAVVSRSKVGQIYYFNSKTGERTWDRPPTFDSSLPEPNTNSTKEEPLTKSGNKLKIKGSPVKHLRNSNASAPYSKRPSADINTKTGVKTQTKERKNLGSFAHTFHPPAKPSIDRTQEEQSPGQTISVAPLSSSSSGVSLNIKNKKSGRVVQAPDSIFSEEELENQSGVPSVTSQSTPTPTQCREPLTRTWLKDVPLAILNSSEVLDSQIINKYRPDGPLHSAKQGKEKRPENPEESNPAMRSCVKSSSGKLQCRRDGGVSVARVRSEERRAPYQASDTKRRSSGMGEERMRKLREQLTEEVKKKEEDKKQSPQRLSQDNTAKPTKRKGLLPTPPSYMRVDRDSNSKKNIVPKEPSAKRGLLPTPPGVVRLDNSANSRKNIKHVPTETTRKRALPSPSGNLKVDSNSNITNDVLPPEPQKITNSVVDYSSNFKFELFDSNTIPAGEIIECEAMDVDEEEQILSDIKALRTAATWESFDPKCTPMEIEILAVNSDTTSTPIIVLDTNILLAHLSFVRDLRDTLKLNGDLPFLYLPWMVLQELDRLKERSSKQATSARAAVSFLNDSFKRKHPRVRGQTGREASRARNGHVEELCPDDSILESCLQLQEKGLHTLLLSNDVSLCNKALVHNIKAFTKVQLTNEMRNSSETNSLLYKARSPPPEKKVSVTDRLRSSRQPTDPYPITSPPVKTQPIQIERKQTTSVLEGLKNILLDTFSKVLSTGMEAVYGQVWTKRVLYKPPWELHNVFICIAKHWFALCDNTTPEPVQKVANKLRKIFQKSVNDDYLGEIITLTTEITNRLPFKFDKIIAPLEEHIQAITSGRINQCPEQDCQVTESQSSAVQSDIPSVDSNVLAYFGSLWNILHSFCTNLKEKLDNGIILDSDTRIHCKEMLNGTEELVKSIRGVLSVPENELDIRHPGLQGIFDILRSATPPPGAEPLQLQDVYNFCIQPKERLILFNGLSQLEDCGIVLVSALKSVNNYSFN